MTVTAKIRQLFLVSLFLGVAGYSLFMSSTRPHYNWDMLMYIASAKALDGGSLQEIHAYTYRQTRQVTSPKQFKVLTTLFYNHETYKHPKLFQEQLPFYRVKPLYIGLVYLLHKAGVHIASATHLISGVSVALALMLLCLLMLPYSSNPLVYLLPPLALVFDVVHVARLSTPDGLAFFGMMLAVYLLLKQRTLPLLFLLPLLVGIRTDYVLFVAPLGLLLLWSNPRYKWWTMLSLGATAGLYLTISILSQNAGWSVLFFFTFIQKHLTPLSRPVSVSFQDYLVVLFDGLSALPSKVDFVTYVVLTGGGFWALKQRLKEVAWPALVRSRTMLLFVTGLLFAGTHFLLFPVVKARFFLGAYMLGFLSLVWWTEGTLEMWSVEESSTTKEHSDRHPMPVPSSGNPLLK